jgi:hypothetical protein
MVRQADRWLLVALTCAFFLGLGVELRIFEAAKKKGNFVAVILLLLLGIGAYLLAYFLVGMMP